ncbi:UNVERIFIED_CONTAM: hypothetical protein K2H54_052524 [Gekko kuhli]
MPTGGVQEHLILQIWWVSQMLLDSWLFSAATDRLSTALPILTCPHGRRHSFPRAAVPPMAKGQAAKQGTGVSLCRPPARLTELQALHCDVQMPGNQQVLQLKTSEGCGRKDLDGRPP